jgi:presenilin-like A22 family membrane protease
LTKVRTPKPSYRSSGGGGARGGLTRMAQNRYPIGAMFISFALVVLLALGTTAILPREYKAFGEENEQSVANPLLYFVIIILFTGLILLIVKMGFEWIVKYIILGAVSISIVYVCYPPLYILMGGDVHHPEANGVVVAIALAIIIACFVTTALTVYPEWYVLDVTGLFMAVGVTAIIGFSMGVLPILLLLIILAVYDAISVYKTKHMVALADSVMDLRLPILLVIPKHLPYTFLEEERLKKQLEGKKEREAMFMGLGDIIIPGALAVSAFVFLDPDVMVMGMIGGNLLVALMVLVGSLVGFFGLMFLVMSGNPQAGLPLLNGGAIAGYVVSSFMVYGGLAFSFATGLGF